MFKMFRFNNKVRSYVIATTSRNLRDEVLRIFAKRHIFFRRAKPVSECYPYIIHDPFELFSKPSGYESLKLVGENWLERDIVKQKPIAVLFGFNDWKLGFAADYLPEYRCAFAKRKTFFPAALLILRYLNPKPMAIVAWGMNEPNFIRRYAAILSIDFYRMEDGFIRSVKLGASHSTPYSLVLDKIGLYYDSTKPSEIENIINNHDFSESSEIIKNAENIMALIRQHGLTKYNPPSFAPLSQTKYALRKRVLVIGQVDNDVSLRLGNPDGWSMEDMLFLAKQENPGAEILYRPHPDVYAGYQKSRFKQKRIGLYATIMPPEVPLAESLDGTDHVYTISSLAGMDALIRGIRVTTLGAPFYVGWGLTDDRCSLVAKRLDFSSKNPFIRRKQKRTITELFAAVYLLYPRYLADLNDATNGCVVACYRIIGEMEAGEAMHYFDAKQPLDKKKNIIKSVVRSSNWIRLFSAVAQADFGVGYYETVLRTMNAESVLLNPTEEQFHIAAVLYIYGFLKTDSERDLLLKRVRTQMSTEALNTLLLQLWGQGKNTHIAVSHYAWLLESVGDNQDAYTLLSMPSNDPVVFDTETGEIPIEEPKDAKEAELVARVARAELELKTRNFIGAKNELYRLLIQGEAREQSLSMLAEIARLTFDFSSAVQISLMLAKIIKPIAAAKLHMQVAGDLRFIYPFSEKQFIASAFAAAIFKPDTVKNISVITDLFMQYYAFNEFPRYFTSALRLDNNQMFEKAQAHIILEEPERSIPILQHLLERDGDDYRYLSVLCQAYSYLREFDKARDIITYAMRKFKNVYTYKEALRLSVVMNDGDRGRVILNEIKANNMDVGEMMERKMHYVNREIHDALITLRHIPLCDMIKYYYPKQYIARGDIEANWSNVNLLILGNYGPGDEIRFGQIYADILNDIDIGRVTICCDPRFLGLLQRSYQELDFVGVARVREHGQHFSLDDYRDLPGYDLHVILDNVGHQEMLKADKALFATDLLAKYRKNYADFHGKGYLVADPARVTHFKKLLAHTGKPLVGISWRSSLTTFSRNEHYLTIQELEPIFRIPGLQFVNLQYDDCKEELMWVDDRFPGKLINLPDLDQFNDLDGVAALMKSLDLIVTAATTVDALAGSLGCPTWILSNSSELNWRKVEGGLTDIWHNSMTHLEGDILGDKASLAEALKYRLQTYAENAHTRNAA